MVTKGIPCCRVGVPQRPFLSFRDESVADSLCPLLQQCGSLDTARSLYEQRPNGNEREGVFGGDVPVFIDLVAAPQCCFKLLRLHEMDPCLLERNRGF
eukprot:gene1227-biopygen9549